MAPPAKRRSALHGAVVRRLRDCMPPEVEPASWVAEKTGLQQQDAAALLEGSVAISVDSADAVLRACCNEELVSVAAQVTAGGYPVEGD